MRSFLVLVMSLGVVWIVGCSTTAEPEATPYEAALRQARTCEEVLEAIQADEMAKVDLELKQFLDQDGYYRFGGPVVDGGFGAGGAGGDPEEFGADSPTSGDADAPDGFSDTNRQVADVDEADIVKVGDGGRKLYVIRGNGFYEFDSWPPEETSMASDLEIEGGPMEMFVHGDRAVVFSGVYSVEGLDDGDLCPDYSGGPEPAIADADIAYYCGRSYVKVTVIDIGGDSNEVVRELYVDGWYSSSRRHDDIVRVVVQSTMQRPASVPNIYQVVYDGSTDTSEEANASRARAWAELAKDAIRATTLEQWLPAWGERIDGEMVELPFQCTDFYSPAPGLTNYGISQVLGLDINDAEKTALTSILGQASHVYANSDTLVLAQPDWAWYDHDVDFDRTSLHRFVVSADGERTPYQGSGFVEGVINDQFSIDERDGVIRVATTRTTYAEQPVNDVRPDIWIAPVTHNLISTLRLDEGQLQVVGKTPDLAEGERIFSARFLGDIGYIVTFRQVDPLFAIDLSDPEAPIVLGELKIPGFSDYMHPLGSNHLLTIGRDIDEQTQVDRGTALQIFDVSDPANPLLAHKSLVGEGYSQANHNHKAFNFYAGESADAGVLAFPFVSYDSSFSSTLELWDVSAEDGFRRHGAVDHSDLVVDECGGAIPFEDFYGYCGYEPEITRGVFIDEYIYSISHGGIRVHTVADLTPIATAPF
jgi:hypothetical protein